MKNYNLYRLIIVAALNVASANNNLFLPGDAFFPTRLNEVDFSRLSAELKSGPVFEHSALDGYEGAFCGYAGYAQARIPSVDEKFLNNLKKAYRYVRENVEQKELLEIDRDGKKKLVETNGIGVLFYSVGFDYPKFRLGLQYNENWVAEVLKFGHRQQEIRLCCIVNTPDGIMESWRDSNLVRGLKVELPDVELMPVPKTTAPVTVLEPVKALVVDSRYFTHKDEDHEVPAVLVVDSEGVTELSKKADEDDDGELIQKLIED